MAKVNFDTAINDGLYSLYNNARNAEARALTAKAIKDLVIAKVIYERWEKGKGGRSDGTA